MNHFSVIVSLLKPLHLNFEDFKLKSVVHYGLTTTIKIRRKQKWAHLNRSDDLYSSPEIRNSLIQSSVWNSLTKIMIDHQNFVSYRTLWFVKIRRDPLHFMAYQTVEYSVLKANQSNQSVLYDSIIVC